MVSHDFLHSTVTNQNTFDRRDSKLISNFERAMDRCCQALVSSFLLVSKLEILNTIRFVTTANSEFAKFEKFLPHSIIIPNFLTVGSQMPELDGGGGLFCPLPI